MGEGAVLSLLVAVISLLLLRNRSSFLVTLGYSRKFLEKMRFIKEWAGFIPCIRNLGNITYLWR
jgi:hypothetical protein